MTKSKKTTNEQSDEKEGIKRARKTNTNDTIIATIREILAESITESKESITESITEFIEESNNKFRESIEKTIKEVMKGESELTKIEQTIVKNNEKISWNDIAGLEKVKQTLIESVELPIKFPFLFKGVLKPPQNILLYGPPGTGKTLLARTLSIETKSTFFCVSSADILSKWIGEAEQSIRDLFTAARNRKPSVIFIDEIDSIGSDRNCSKYTVAMKTELLIQMQGVNSNNDGVCIIGATNMPWNLDPALRRRFGKRIFIPLPDKATRLSFCKKMTEKDYPQPQEIIEKLANDTEGFTCSDLSVVFREAFMEPVRACLNAEYFKYEHKKYTPLNSDVHACKSCSEYDTCDSCGRTNKDSFTMTSTNINVPKLLPEHIFTALSKTSKTVSNSENSKFDNWTKQFGITGQ